MGICNSDGLWKDQDGYCVRCGKRHVATQVRTAVRKPTPKVETVIYQRPRTYDVSTAAVHYWEQREPFIGDCRDAEKYARKLLALLQDRFRHKITLQVKPTTGATYYRHSEKLIVLGWKRLEWYIRGGGVEYVTVANRLGMKQSLPGYSAIHHITLHEYAHCIQRTEGSMREKPHGSFFLKSIKRAIHEFPILID